MSDTFLTLIATLAPLYILHNLFVAPGNLVDWQIRVYTALGLLKIENHRKTAIQPNSLDVHLGRFFAKQKEDGSFDSFEANEIILNPGDFVLATTEEFFQFPRILHGVLQGKSSWARLGLYVESAGLFDSGFDGEAVVELTNQGKAPLILEAGKPIAQMIFLRNLPTLKPYGAKGHYQGQRGATQSCFDKAVAKADERIAKQDKLAKQGFEASLN